MEPTLRVNRSLLASLSRISVTFIILGCLWSSLAFSWPVFSFVDLTQSLGRYFAYCHLLALVVLLLLRNISLRLRMALVCWNLLLLSHYGMITYSWYFPKSNPASCNWEDQTALSVLFANVYSANTNYTALRKQIESLNPDYVALNEVTPEWAKRLALGDLYQSKVEIVQHGNFGIALYSKYPLEATPNGYGHDLTPSIKAMVAAGPHKGLQLVAIHSVPPLAGSLAINRLLIRRIATEVRHAEHPVLVMGDFNATIYSALFRKLFWGGEMQHAGAGGPYFTTWDAESVLRYFMLDHILYKGCIKRSTYERGEAFGSDHYPLIFKGTIAPAM